MGEVFKPLQQVTGVNAIPDRWASGLAMLVPMWEHSGRPRDIITAVETLVDGAADWAVGPPGVGRVYDGASTDDLPDHPQALFGTGDMAVLAVFRISGAINAQINTVISNGISGANGANRGWKLTVNGFNSSDRTFGFQADNFISSSANAIVDGQLHVAVVTRQSGFVRLYLDGVQVASGSFPGNWDTTADEWRTRHGAMTDSSGLGDTFHMDGDIYLTATWRGRHLTQSDAIAFTRDPYALLRGSTVEQLFVPILPVRIDLQTMAPGSGKIIINQ